MLAHEQAQVAVWIGLHAESLFDRTPRLSSEALSEYWIASRCRLDHWARALHRLGDSRTAPPHDAREQLQCVAYEVIVSEVLTRVVAGVTRAHDALTASDDAAPIGQNTLSAHRDTRRRLVTLLNAWWPRDSVWWAHTRPLIRRADRWCDTLLAHIGDADDLAPLACEPRRLSEFAYDAREQRGASAAFAQLYAHSIYESFAADKKPPQSAELNRRIAGAALGLFGEQAFDSHGLMIPAWMIRADRSSEEAMRMIDRLFGDDFQRTKPAKPERWRWAT